MGKIAVVYWSGTGNTEAMANAVADGIGESGAEAVVHTAADFCEGMVSDYDALAFGCPAMGAEVLEEDEFEPMFTACLPKIAGKRVGLFGSYGWGDGEWMREWETTCRNSGVDLVADGVICCEEPDEDGIADCKALGAKLVQG